MAILARSRPDPDPDLDRLLDQLELDGLLAPDGRDRLRRHTDGHRKTAEDVEFLLGLIERSGSMGYARAEAARQAERAEAALGRLAWLPDSRHRDALRQLVHFVHERSR